MSFIVFVSMLIISYSLLSLESRNNTVNYFFVALTIGLLSAYLGSDVFADRRAYDFMFLFRFPITNMSIESLLNNTIEPGFIIYNRVLYNISSNPRILYFTSTFLVTLFDLIILGKLSNNKLSGRFYIINLHIVLSMFLIRQSLAATFVNVSYYYFNENKYIRSLLLVFLALSFHASAIIIIPIYLIFILKKKWTKKTSYFYALLGIIFILFYSLILNRLFKISFISQYFGFYEDKEVIGNIFIIFKALPYHLILLAIYKKQNILRAKIKNFDRYFLIAIINSFLWIVSYKMYWMWRLSLFTILPTIYLFSVLFSVEYFNKSNRIKYKYLLMILTLLITLREIYLILY